MVRTTCDGIGWLELNRMMVRLVYDGQEGKDGQDSIGNNAIMAKPGLALDRTVGLGPEHDIVQ